MEELLNQQPEQFLRMQLESDINKLVLKCSDIVGNFTDTDLSKMSKWYNLLDELMRYIQKHNPKHLHGYDKGFIVIEAIIIVMNAVYDNHTKNCKKKQIKELRNGKLKLMVAIMENPTILLHATVQFKQLIKYIDLDKNGKISRKEVKTFFCCGK